MRRRWWGITALALLAACTAPPVRTPEASPTRTPTPSPSPTALPTPTVTPSLTPSPTASPTPPASPVQTPVPDPTDESRLEPPPRPFPRTAVNSEPPRRVPNAMRSFWITDPETGGRRQIDARLRVQTPSIAIWIELGVWHDIRRLEEAAEVFESQIYPVVRAVFGPEWKPGIDNDPRVHVLHARGLGENVLGYTSSLDEYPSVVYPLSNEAEMIVISADRAEVGSSTYYALLARQFQRLVQWNQDRNEERWLKEGLAELAVALSGFEDKQSEQVFPKQPDTSLIHWSPEESQRGAAFLFAAYFHQRFGDEGTRVLTSEPQNGIRGIDAALGRLGSDLTFEDLFADWLAANYLDSAPDTDGSRRSYADLVFDRPRPVAVHEAYPVETEMSVQQFGADYFVLRGDADLTVQFTGRTQTPSLSVSPYSGQRAWWSNRADESLTTLTRGIDLSGVDEATLTYRVWYDIEPHYDYATIAITALDDEDWHILRTPSGTGANPYSNNPGWGYTGDSDGWIREEVDLSDYAGKEIYLRFSYLTDGAITGEGLLLDDISIPEINYADDVETGLDQWEAKGFLPIGASVPQRYLALLIGHGEGTTVERLSLEQDQSAEWTVPLGSSKLREAVLVISGMAELTSQPAPYQLRISP